MAVTKSVVVLADTRNAVHDEMAAQGSMDDYLHIVVSVTMPFAWRTSLCAAHTNLAHFQNRYCWYLHHVPE